MNIASLKFRKFNKLFEDLYNPTCFVILLLFFIDENYFFFIRITFQNIGAWANLRSKTATSRFWNSRLRSLETVKPLAVDLLGLVKTMQRRWLCLEVMLLCTHQLQLSHEHEEIREGIRSLLTVLLYNFPSSLREDQDQYLRS